MSKSSEKIVKVHLVRTLLHTLLQTLLQTVKNKSLVIPQSKGKYELMKIVELMKPRIPFVDVAIIVILIPTFNEMVIELASGGYVNIPLKVNRHSGKALRNCVAKNKTTCVAGRLIINPTTLPGSVRLDVRPSSKSKVALHL